MLLSNAVNCDVWANNDDGWHNKPEDDNVYIESLPTVEGLQEGQSRIDESEDPDSNNSDTNQMSLTRQITMCCWTNDSEQSFQANDRQIDYGGYTQHDIKR